MEKTGKSKRQVYNLIQKKRKEHNQLISNEEATYLLALDFNIDVYSDLSKDEIENLRTIISKTPIIKKIIKEKQSKKPLVVKIGQEFEFSDKILPRTLASEASKMANVYPMIYVFENSIRFTIIRILSNNGSDWWNSRVQKDIRQKALSRIKQDRKIKWHGKRGVHPIFYVDIGDLSRIISKNWDDFKEIFTKLEWVRVCIDSIEMSRNVIAHNNPLSNHDIKRIEVYFRDWIKQLS